MSGEVESTASGTPEIAEPTAGTSRFVIAYKRDSRALLNILLLALVAILALSGLFIFIEFGTNPSPLHFKENANRQIIEPVPMDQPGISKPALLNWVNEMVSDAFNFNYSNIDKQPAKVYDYFSDVAMKQYLDLLQNDQDFQLIPEYKFVVSVTPLEAPEIVTEKAFRGRYAWQVRAKIAIVFSNGIRRGTQTNTFDFLVWRVPETENPLGITIASFTRAINGRTALMGIGRAT